VVFPSIEANVKPEIQQSRARSLENMVALIAILLILGIIFGVFGFVVKGLIWLAIIGIVLIVASVIWGIIRRGASRV
jgi:membrane-bound ClpP family serine protease